jgi:PAS domain S-box-containing protein
MATRSRQSLNEAEALRLVVEGTSAVTGVEFFRALARNLARALGTVGAWVTEYLPEQHRLRALGMWLEGRFVDHFEYDTSGTVCATVVESAGVVHIPERLIELFPRDTDLVPLKAVSYLGAPLLDADGGVMGHISVLDDKPMPRDPRAVSLIEIFAARAAAEQLRLRAESEVLAREQQLAQLLQSALDAILVLDGEMRVVRANPAAGRLFGGDEAALAGAALADILTPESAARVVALARELVGRPEGRQHLWIPQDLVARRRDQSVFPAEVTVSRFVRGRDVFFTLILRNADERTEAARQIQRLTQETEYLREVVREAPGHGDLLGRSDCMRAVFSAVQQVGPTEATVLITGETGTGKELVARSIHRASLRADGPLVLVNCAAIPANLIESEFFGHERGAFTGAVGRREGRFAMADGGTIFLDEVGELPIELQAKLLRVLQEGEFEPLGSSRTVRVDVRVVAATHRDLRAMCAAGKFREDLFFRLHVFPIHLPALRERGRDVEHLAAAFVERFARRLGKSVEPLGEAEFALLRSYDWPGNVRELQNIIERALILARSGRIDLARAMAGSAGAVSPPRPDAPGEARVFTAAEFAEIERANLRRALSHCGGRISGAHGAARLLGLAPSTLSSRLKALGIERRA